MGNNHYVMQAIQDGEPARLKAFVAWLLNAAKGYAPKLVNPGGVEIWKATRRQRHGTRRRRSSISTSRRGRSSRALRRRRANSACRIRCTFTATTSGMPGNWTTTLETMKALEGRRGHLTHVQFHSYGGEPDARSSFCSETPQLAEYVNAHPNLTVDVGQVLFGETTSMTGDGPLGYYLHKVTGRNGSVRDTEMEAGCGIVPIEYKNKSLVHAVQWAIGLEWYLLVDDPWRIGDEHRSSQRRLVPGVSGDHRPADGPRARGDVLSTLPPGVREADRAGRSRPRIHARRDCHHHAGRRRPGFSGWRKGISAPVPMPT